MSESKETRSPSKNVETKPAEKPTELLEIHRSAFRKGKPLKNYMDKYFVAEPYNMLISIEGESLKLRECKKLMEIMDLDNEDEKKAKGEDESEKPQCGTYHAVLVSREWLNKCKEVLDDSQLLEKMKDDIIKNKPVVNDEKYMETFDVALDQLNTQKKYEEAIKGFTECLKMQPKNHVCEYNIACGYSMLRKEVEALEWLGKAVEHNLFNHPGMMQDDQLDNIKETQAFEELATTVLVNSFEEYLPAYTEQYDSKDFDGLRSVISYWLAIAYAKLKDATNALKWLKRAIDHHYVEIHQKEIRWPLFKEVKDDNEFNKYVQELYAKAYRQQFS